MAILSDGTLHSLLHQFVKESDYGLINQASIDIRIGKTIILEKNPVSSESFGKEAMGAAIDLSHDYTSETPFWLAPGDFALVSTYEYVMVPNGYAIELKLKSSAARKGFNHSLAFWVDPGWNGILTMEIQNVLKHHHVPLWYGMRFAQMIIHTLDKLSLFPYGGRYQNAAQAEAAKYTGVVNDPVYQ